MRKILKDLGPLLAVCLFVSALWMIHRALEEYHYGEIVRTLKALPAARLSSAALLTFASYFLMTGYDLLALRYVGARLAVLNTALVSFIGFTFSNNIGIGLLTGGSIRYRFYSAWGLSAEQITKVAAFCSLTIWIGYFAAAGLVFLIQPLEVPKALHLPFASVSILGLLFLFLVTGYFLWNVLRKAPFSILGWEFPVLPAPSLIVQLALSALDWIVCGTIMYVLLGPSHSLSFWPIIGVYLLAQTLGMISQVPGGLGVFEATALYLYSPHIPAPTVAGALLAYRIIYYLIPLLIAVSMLGAHEIGMKRQRIQKAARVLGMLGSSLVPQILSITTFLSGIVLLFSGVTPGVESRLLWLQDFLPLPVLEVSHFLGSLAGLGLLLLARGIQLRLDAAFLFTCILLAAGSVLSLLKGLDYEEAAVLILMLGVLLPCRDYFYRKASLFSQRFTAGWIAAIVIVLIGSVWLGFFAYKHTEFSSEQWWHFSLHGDASRSLRATVGVISVTLFLALARLLRPAPTEPALPGEDDLVKLLPVITRSKKTCANLALLRDKRLLISPSGKSFIMYAIEGRSWIAMGDPIGETDECRELIWRFREMCDLQKGWTVFYEIGLESLHLYLDLGLSVSKIGEEAKIDLEAYSLEGGEHKKYRHLVHSIEKEGCSFEIIPRDRVPDFLQEFRRISDAWLAEKNTREKRFSLGSFKEEYMKYFPAGVVKKEGKVLAFANIWEGAEKEELSIDLMRYLKEAPYGVTDYLIISLMLWGKKEGYRWFNMGMAPLSGIEARAPSPFWNRLGAFVYRHGEHFYNFQGLRQYKEKFGPVWEPRYIAISSGLALPRVLTNLAALISGGLKGVIAK